MDRITFSMKAFCFFANRNKEVKQMLEGLSSVIFVDVKDGQPFAVNLDGGKISVVSGKPERSDGTVTAPRESLRRIVSGQLSQEDAFNKKMVESSGSIRDVMMFRHVLNLTMEKSFWVKLLRSTAGRFM